jgi:hypothetical protein
MGSPQGRKGGVSGLQAFVGAVVLMIAATVITGLYLAGSPSKERGRRFDEQRVSNLQSIASAIDARFERTGTLPTDLAELAVPGNPENYVIGSMNDPATMTQYEYLPADATKYQLCATFDLATPESPAEPGMKRPYPAPYAMESYPVGLEMTNWSHPAGRHCFSMDVSLRTARVACGLTNPCAAGQTCATLPEKKGTVCVPAGKECLAAGCLGECVIMESYPVQVRCTPAPTSEKRAPNSSMNSCDLMREKTSGKVDCFGCGTTVCKDPAPGWEPYDAPEVGIPYACYVDDNGGCALAQ